MSAPPDRLPLDGVTCPMCDSELTSIDWRAADDDPTRASFGRVRWLIRYFGVMGGAAVVFTALYAFSVVRNGGTFRDWGNIVQGTMLLVVAAVVWVPLLWKAWRMLHERLEGRLISCHACGHRWRH